MLAPKLFKMQFNCGYIEGNIIMIEQPNTSLNTCYDSAATFSRRMQSGHLDRSVPILTKLRLIGKYVTS
jgi:hypothetical protein